MPINLPKQPNGYQFEEAVSAKIRSLGYFTENRTILDHEGREILELDVVASPASDAFLGRILVDAKKDTAGFSDIFKIYGWRTFLKIPRGCIIHGNPTDAPALAAFREICPKLDVHTSHFDLSASITNPFDTIPLVNSSVEEVQRQTVASVGWYQLIADRLALEDFHKVRKANSSDALFARVRQYRRACHLAFFESDPLKRVEFLYNAFKEDPGISKACVEWQAARSGKSIKDIWSAVRDTNQFPWIQHVMTLEARARVLIIKNGVEATLISELSNDKLKAFERAFTLAWLPPNFCDGFAAISKNPNRTKIPYILQLYIENFGGFIIDDEDRVFLAGMANAPIEVVNEALNLFDLFFPTGGGWRFWTKEIHMMKMIPAYLRGVGAFLRHESRKLNSYSTLAPKNGWLISKWHNAAYSLLENELAVKP